MVKWKEYAQTSYERYQAKRKSERIPDKCETCAFFVAAQHTDDWAITLADLNKYGLSDIYRRRIVIHVPQGRADKDYFCALRKTEEFSNRYKKCQERSVKLIGSGLTLSDYIAIRQSDETHKLMRRMEFVGIGIGLMALVLTIFQILGTWNV